METEEKKEGSLGNAAKAGVLSQREKQYVQFSLKKANRWSSWVAGIVFALVPVITCKLGAFLHSDNTNLLENYQKFITEFFNGGSFLWLSITVLVMSLLDLLLYGIKEMKSEKCQFGTRIFIALSIIFVIVGIYIYISNIEHSINATLMCGLSWVAFAFFCATSGIITFKILKEA